MKLFILFALIFIVSCSSYQWKKFNQGPNGHRRFEYSKTIDVNTDTRENLEKLKVSYIELYNKDKSLTIADVSEDNKFLEMIIKTIHPYSYLKERGVFTHKNQLSSLFKKIEEIKRPLKSEVYKTELQKVLESNKKVGVVIEEDLLDPSRIAETCPLVKNIKFENIKIKNNVFAKFKLNRPVKDIYKFNKDLTYSMNNKDGLIIDSRDYEDFNFKLIQLIKSHFYGLEIASSLGSLEYFQKPAKVKYYTQTWVTDYYQGLFDLFYARVSNLKKKNKEKLIDSTLERMNQLDQDSSKKLGWLDFQRGDVRRDINKFKFKKPIYFLVDKSCRDNCELLLQSLRENKNVKVIGEVTRGTSNFENRMIIKLPKSGITLKVPYSYTKFYDNRSIEGVGYEPNFRISPNKINLSKIISKDVNFNEDVKNIKKVKVSVIRPQVIGSFWRYDLFIDGKEEKNKIASLKGAEYVEFEISPGLHTIYVNANGWSKVKVNAKEGEQFSFTLASKYKEGSAFITAELINVSNQSVNYFKTVLDKGNIIGKSN